MVAHWVGRQRLGSVSQYEPYQVLINGAPMRISRAPSSPP